MLDGDEPVQTYKEYLEVLYPFLQPHEELPEGYESRLLYNKAVKKRRLKLQNAFTEKDNPGECQRQAFDDMIARLRLSADEQEHVAALSEQGKLSDGQLSVMWNAGYHYMLPSFFELLRWVHSQNLNFHCTGDNGASPLRVSLALRTFGSDVPEISKELDLLQSGEHPSFEQLLPTQADDGTPLTLTIDREAIAAFYRDAHGSDGTLLVKGTVEEAPFPRDMQRSLDERHDDVLRFYTTDESAPPVVHTGFSECYQAITSLVNRHMIVAFRDYWAWWGSHGEHADYGKLLLIDDTPLPTEGKQAEPSCEANRMWHVFFDDHIERDHAHIVDARSLQTGEPIPFEDVASTHLVHVDPYFAVYDREYFVNGVKAVLSATRSC